MSTDILNLIREKGVLLDKDVFEALKQFKDIDSIPALLDSLIALNGQKMITRSSLTKQYESSQEFVSNDSLNPQVMSVLVRLGLNIEIKTISRPINTESIVRAKEKYKIFYAKTTTDKKITLQDFVGHFRARYKEIQGILLQRTGLDAMISINKLSGNRQKFTIIAMITEKRVTKNKNLMVKVEDLTGETTILFKADSDVFHDANELQLDEVVAIKCSGNTELVMGKEIIFPEAIIPQKIKFEEEVCCAFISDIHVGSHKFLRTEFENFIYWLNSDHELAKKIKYLFIVGDAVDGVGVFPGQERFLEIKDLKGQYDSFADYIKKIPKSITIFMCPGQHDASRVPEPQPPVDKRYAGALYDLENVVLVSNPTMVKLIEGDKEFKVLMYHGASIHSFINNIEDLRLIKAHKSPAKAIKHMLKRRHLAPTHSSVTYVPNPEKDPLVISETPDILCTGEVHRLDIERHNGVLIMTGSCWQAQTEFEEKIGNIPDPCKVPVFNIKTHELKILDFTGSGEVA